MERLSVALRDSPSPRNLRGQISMPFLELPGLQQSGLEGRGYLKHLCTCDK